MAANLIARYIWEVNTLAKTRHGLSLDELNEQWQDSYLYDGKEIVRKTWWEHRNQINLQFGINIEYNNQTKRYFIKSRNEINRPAVQEWMLNSFAVGNMLLIGKDLRDRILCESIPSGYEYLTNIIQAMRENKVLALTYQSFLENEIKEVTAEPYFIKVFKQRWYLIAHVPDHENLCTYALDRIQELAITEQKFKLTKKIDAHEMYATAYGIVVGKEEQVERIELNVYNNQAKYFRSLPLHHSQREIATTEYCSVFEYYLQSTYDFIQELLLHGPDVEVIHPNHLRLLMKQRITDMIELYK